MFLKILFIAFLFRDVFSADTDSNFYYVIPGVGNLDYKAIDKNPTIRFCNVNEPIVPLPHGKFGGILACKEISWGGGKKISPMLVDWGQYWLPVRRREIYGGSLYKQLSEQDKKAKDLKKITFLCHSHGGNVAFMNGGNQDDLKKFLTVAKTNNILVEYHLFATPVTPPVESSLKDLLDTYDNLFVYSYTADNDIIQRYDIAANFPFCNRVYSIDHKRLYQCKITGPIKHNDLAAFIQAAAEVVSHFEERDCVVDRDDEVLHSLPFIYEHQQYNIERLDGKKYHGFLNKLFFYHTGKIISSVLLIVSGFLFWQKFKNKKLA
jgi:hypothetical protein